MIDNKQLYSIGMVERDTGIGRDMIFGGSVGDDIVANVGETTDALDGNNIVVGDYGFVDYLVDDVEPGDNTHDIDVISSFEDATSLGGDDRIVTGAANDIILGGAGGDILHGDAGSDLVRISATDFEGATGIEADIIRRYQAGKARDPEEPQILNLMDALKQSVAEAKKRKPPEEEPAPPADEPVALDDEPDLVAIEVLAYEQGKDASPENLVNAAAPFDDGDKILDKSLQKIGGKGLFIKELEVAMQVGDADIAVHSMKDVPMEFPEGLGLGVICEREDPTDAFVSNRYRSLDELPAGSGCFICSGFSGHGFKLGPAVGEMMADLVTGERRSEFDPHMFRFGRFAEDDPVRGQYEYSIVG